MQTYTHLLLTAVWRKHSQKTTLTDPGKALLLGSVLPDVPLVLISIGYVVHRRWLCPELPDKTRCSPTFDFMYFNNPWWIAAHNLLHSPLMILLYLLIAWWAIRHKAWWGPAFMWFALGCGGHSIIDILTHVNDGPVLLFPLDWHMRFTAPVSYWDPAHGGRPFTFFEHTLDVILLIYLWFNRQPWQPPAGCEPAGD